MTLDFDAEKSVVIAGARNVLVKPVIKLLVRDKDQSLAEAGQAGRTESEEEPEATPAPTATAVPTATATASPTPKPSPTPAALPEPAKSPAITAASLQPPVGDPLETPPDLNEITFSEVGADGMLTVTGQAGAVPGSYTVFVQSLHTGAAIKTTSADDGSFQADILATEGSTIVVGYGDGQARDLMGGSPAVQMTVSLPRPSSPTEIPFTVAGPDSVGTGYWIAEGTQNGWSYGPGETIRYTIDVTYTSPNITGSIDLEEIRTRRLYPQLTLSRFSDAEGDPVQATFIPVLMTPTGLPIFSRDGYEHNADPFEVTVRNIERTGDTIAMSIDFSQRVPDWLPSGYYVGRNTMEPQVHMGGRTAGEPAHRQRGRPASAGRGGDPDHAAGDAHRHAGAAPGPVDAVGQHPQQRDPRHRRQRGQGRLRPWQ